VELSRGEFFPAARSRVLCPAVLSAASSTKAEVLAGRDAALRHPVGALAGWFQRSKKLAIWRLKWNYLHIETMSAKDILLEVAEKLPPEATLNDAIYESEFRQAIRVLWGSHLNIRHLKTVKCRMFRFDPNGYSQCKRALNPKLQGHFVGVSLRAFCANHSELARR
jgi:hypothetical protein